MMLKVSAVVLIMVVVITVWILVDSRFFSETLLQQTEIESASKKADTLVLLLHAFDSGPRSLDDLRQVIVEHYGEANTDILQPSMPLGTMSVADPSAIVAELLQLVDGAWEARASTGNPYAQVVFVGHSFGALFARKLYVLANAETMDAPFEQQLVEAANDIGIAGFDAERPWASKVKSLVLMAGMNRGWSISHHMSIPRAALMQLGVGLGYVIELFSGRVPTVMQIRRGGPFITQLRLQWLAMEQQLAEQGKRSSAAVTVQLLGTIDDLVSPEDNVDLVTGSDFVYLEVPRSGHKNVVQMDASADGEERRKALRKALKARRGEHRYAEDVYSPVRVNEAVTDVLFVIHGIRDKGYWTQKIARRAQQRAQQLKGQRRIIATETSSYGYFPMLSFLVPGARQEKVAWLMDRYTEARARFPKARFQYVGHSHGTYLLARALQDYESVRFQHVVFAGSVVRTNYEWNSLIASGRVERALNFVATADWVVALFPKAFEELGVQDLGSAGHDGFLQAARVGNLEQPGDFVAGGHSAALQEQMWDTIAEFVVRGSAALPPAELMSDEQALWLKWPSRLAWAVPFIIVGLILWGLYALVNSGMREWLKTLSVMLYLYGLWIVVTRI